MREPLDTRQMRFQRAGRREATPDQNFICSHFNRIISKLGLDMIHIVGPQARRPGASAEAPKPSPAQSRRPSARSQR